MARRAALACRGTLAACRRGQDRADTLRWLRWRVRPHVGRAGHLPVASENSGWGAERWVPQLNPTVSRCLAALPTPQMPGCLSTNKAHCFSGIGLDIAFHLNDHCHGEHVRARQHGYCGLAAELGPQEVRGGICWLRFMGGLRRVSTRAIYKRRRRCWRRWRCKGLRGSQRGLNNNTSPLTVSVTAQQAPSANVARSELFISSCEPLSCFRVCQSC